MAISVAGGVRPGKIIEIEHRLYQQLILGKQKAGPTLLDDLDRELEADANKLDVEREAILSRLLKQIQAREVFEAISKQLTETVNNAIE
ncbi:MAG: HDOD domain-containing protein, partial [Shewanella sp.]